MPTCLLKTPVCSTASSDFHSRVIYIFSIKRLRHLHVSIIFFSKVMYTFIHSNHNTWLNHSLLQELKGSEAKIFQWYSHRVAFCDALTTGMHCYYIYWLNWKIPTPSTKGCITDCHLLHIYTFNHKIKISEFLFYEYYSKSVVVRAQTSLKMAIPINPIYCLQLIIKCFFWQSLWT